jgi:HEAT repeat protein
MPDRIDRRSAGVIVMLVIAGLVIPLLIFVAPSWYRSGVREQIVETIEKLGGQVELAPKSRDLVAVNLAGAAIDGELLQRLAEIPTIRRLDLTGAELQTDDYRALSRLASLQVLSLERTNISENDLPLANLQLTTLSLSGTAVGNTGLSRLSALPGLANLDVAQTVVTAEGLESLPSFPALNTVTLDDQCITAESLLHLQASKPIQLIRIHVTSGVGKPSWELLSTVNGLQADGWRYDQRIWTSRSKWDETVAGVVEAVAIETQLSEAETQTLLRILASFPASTWPSRPVEGSVSNPPESAAPSSQSAQRPATSSTQTPAIDSVEEFIEQLRQTPTPPLPPVVARYARDQFNQSDVPTLLDAFRSIGNHRESEPLLWLGAYLLVRHGLDNPEAVAELKSMLQDDDSLIRAAAIYAFGRFGARYWSDQDWRPGEQHAEIGVPLLLSLCADEDSSTCFAAAEVLGDLAYLHPKHATDVLPAFVKMINRGYGGYVKREILRIVAANEEAARAIAPALRRDFAAPDFEIPPDYLQPERFPPDQLHAHRRNDLLNVLCVVARSDPALASDVAVECLDVMRKRRVSSPPLVSFLSRENSEVVRVVVRGLIEMADSDNEVAVANAREAIEPIAIAIRNWTEGSVLPKS